MQKGTNPVLGSWELVRYVDQGGNNPQWREYGPEIIYQKHLSENHFTWINYDKSNDQLLGMGGGTYVIDSKGRYVENIQFFYPPGSSELGQSIPFELYVSKGRWLHTGYAKIMEYADDGTLIATDSSKIEEEWKRIKDTGNNLSLVGTWQLVSYREKEGGNMIEYPQFIAYQKIITPTHFIWIKFDKESDQIYAAGSGPYTYDGQTYVETVEMTYPKGSEVNGMDIRFVPEVNTNKWMHKVTMPLGTGTLFIDEIWVPKNFSLTEVTDFIE